LIRNRLGLPRCPNRLQSFLGEPFGGYPGLVEVGVEDDPFREAVLPDIATNAY
jgi:hypothetical protein